MQALTAERVALPVLNAAARLTGRACECLEQELKRHRDLATIAAALARDAQFNGWCFLRGVTTEALYPENCPRQFTDLDLLARDEATCRRLQAILVAHGFAIQPIMGAGPGPRGEVARVETWHRLGVGGPTRVDLYVLGIPMMRTVRWFPPEAFWSRLSRVRVGDHTAPAVPDDWQYEIFLIECAERQRFRARDLVDFLILHERGLARRPVTLVGRLIEGALGRETRAFAGVNVVGPGSRSLASLTSRWPRLASWLQAAHDGGGEIIWWEIVLWCAQGSGYWLNERIATWFPPRLGRRTFYRRRSAVLLRINRAAPSEVAVVENAGFSFAMLPTEILFADTAAALGVVG